MTSIVLGGTEREATALELENRALARRAAAESFVLLENNGVLPLQEKKIALYGSGARMTVKGGTGSGAVRERYSVSIADGLLNAGYTISTTNWLERFDKFYNDTYEAYRQGVEEKVKGVTNFYQILTMAGKFNHPTGIPLEEQDWQPDEAAGVKTAIYVLARQAGEGDDRSDVKGDYQLDDVEIENLRTVRAHYEKMIVVINAGGVIDVSFLDEMQVDALVYFVQGGEEGGNALADVLSGRTNFSGRLATGWAYRFEDIPSNTTYSYLGKDKYQQDYNEGIYVGYRYFDTFHVKPRFPFGYGLSYTTFSLACASVQQDGEEVRVAVNVKNTGDRSGREVVQLYATVPFGETGAEYQRLVAFGKTRKIAPGESEKITLTFPVRALTVYEENCAAGAAAGGKPGAYVLRAGAYVLRLGTSSASTTAIQVLTVSGVGTTDLAAQLQNVAHDPGLQTCPDGYVTEICRSLCVPVSRIDEIVPPDRDLEDLTGVPSFALDLSRIPVIHHEYPEKPVYLESTAKWKSLVESMTDEQLAALVCGGTTEPKDPQVIAMGASGSTTTQLYESCGIPNVILSDGPAGLNLTSRITKKADGTWGASRCPENLEAYKRYLFGIVGKAMMARMPDPAEGEEHYQYATAWPCSQLLAQSFDPSLLEAVGDATGKEMEAYGITVWLAPGMNIHRNPLCGRTFEYYSEDPLISGTMAAGLVRGVQSHPGKGVSVKHFACNNCELERNMSSSNVSERALREIYLKGFEIAVKTAHPMTVMAAYNKINGTYCTNNYDLLVDILRNEWGFDGLVMSDWDSMKADRSDCMKAASGDVLKAQAAQCDLVMPGRPDQVQALTQGLKEGIVKREDLLRSAARILEMIDQNTVLGIRKD